MSSSYHGITNSSSLLTSSQNDSGMLNESPQAFNLINQKKNQIFSTGHSHMQMSTSLISNIKNDNNLMIQSLDPNLLSSNIKSHSTVHDVTSRSTNQISVAAINQAIGKEYLRIWVFLVKSFAEFVVCLERQGNPLAAASKMVPVPESLMSPDCPPSNAVHRTALSSNNSSVHSSGYSNLPNNKFAKSKGRPQDFNIPLSRIFIKKTNFLSPHSKLSEKPTNRIGETPREVTERVSEIQSKYGLIVAHRQHLRCDASQTKGCCCGCGRSFSVAEWFECG